jgi:parvulin-like peptidyl-prolyl isomerase
LLETAIDSEIIDKLLLKEALTRGIEVSPEEIDASFDRSRKLLGDEKLDKMLKERNSTEEDYREFLKERLLINRYKETLFKDINVDEDILEPYYEGHKESFSEPEAVRLEIIITENPETAAEISRRIKKGEDFVKVGEEFSQKDDKVIFRRTRWMPSDAILLMVQPQIREGKIGEILEPIQRDNTTEIIKILDKRPARTLSYEEAKDKIRNFFLQKDQQKILEQWYEKKKQEVKIEYINN